MNDEAAGIWRLRHQRLRLAGAQCADCGGVSFPTHVRCPRCGSRNQRQVQMKGTGVVYSHTTVYQAPEGFNPPYTLGLIQLDEGPMVMGRLLADEPQIGQHVEMVTRKLKAHGEDALIVYGYEFRVI